MWLVLMYNLYWLIFYVFNIPTVFALNKLILMLQNIYSALKEEMFSHLCGSHSYQQYNFFIPILHMNHF